MGQLKPSEQRLLVGAVILMSLPLLSLLIFFESLPHQIAIFHKLSGAVTVWSNRTILIVCRLPLMGASAQAIALAMASAGSKLHGKLRESTVQFWGAAIWIILFKWSLESFEAVLAAGRGLQTLVFVLHWAALAVTGVGVITLCFLGLRIWQASRVSVSFQSDVRATFSTGIGIAVALAMTVYFFLAVFPVIGM